MEIKNTALKNTQLKTELRRTFKQKRDAFVASADRVELNKKLTQNLAKVLPEDSQSHWASYCSAQSEADTSFFGRNFLLNWCYPVVTQECLEFYEPNGEWKKNQFGIQEPVPLKSKKISLQEIEGILVPGIAFDFEGHRLGRGKAYYDRTLRNFSGIKIGIVYSVQMTESLPFEAHDVSMDIIVTEKEVLKIR